jgi:hypothetical protein
VEEMSVEVSGVGLKGWKLATKKIPRLNIVIPDSCHISRSWWPCGLGSKPAWHRYTNMFAFLYCPAEVKNAWSYTYIPQYVFLAKHRDNFTCTLPSDGQISPIEWSADYMKLKPHVVN